MASPSSEKFPKIVLEKSIQKQSSFCQARIHKLVKNAEKDKFAELSGALMDLTAGAGASPTPAVKSIDKFLVINTEKTNLDKSCSFSVYFSLLTFSRNS